MSITSYHRRIYNNFHKSEMNEQLNCPLPIQNSYAIDSNPHEAMQDSSCFEYLNEGLLDMAPENEPIAEKTCYQGMYYKPPNHNFCFMQNEIPNNVEISSGRGVHHQKFGNFYKRSEYFGFINQFNTNYDLR